MPPAGGQWPQTSSQPLELVLNHRPTAHQRERPALLNNPHWRSGRRCPNRSSGTPDDELWENRSDNPRLFGPLRQAVERVFKSLKESRRLERHHVRGLRRVGLHAAMSALGFAATLLVNVLAGAERPRWMVRKVA